MQNKKTKAIMLRFVFAIVGLLSLFQIIKKYGMDHIMEEIHRSGFLLILLSITFFPTLLCYSLSWFFATDHKKMDMSLSFSQKVFLFFKYTTMSIAWNNLTPFLKVGGEPLKYMMLGRHLPKKEAFASTVNYNVIHLLATSLCFILTCLILVIFYDIPGIVKWYALLFAFLFSFCLLVSYKLLRTKSFRLTKKHYFHFIRILEINLKLSFRRLKYFWDKEPKTFLVSLGFDVVARFIEGLTFYFSFYLIKHPIGFLSASLLDVGRTFIDTLFFFVPFQIGTREEGVRFFMEKVLSVDPSGFLTAVLLYRFVEIIWIIVGYLVWVSSTTSSSEVRVKSAKPSLGF